ncbi:hypothetical protein F8388_010566 [Cannabis sativa]|uniref:Endonuclease/exonuclease/phosphatase domain-containing protein n=1 Tax=Cannabis sativa TaxID=3483 RepID=A0A7J6FGF1_CANSA|nr:hypothetical protein G4B88_022133 [Cannabis sativa]KAF4384968.1 hypothetical protein F8388_010566 [Cannabis sativa]
MGRPMMGHHLLTHKMEGVMPKVGTGKRNNRGRSPKGGKINRPRRWPDSKLKNRGQTRQKGKLWNFTGIYGDPVKNQRHNSWALLQRLSEEASGPWLIGGDFNEVLHAKEK